MLYETLTPSTILFDKPCAADTFGSSGGEAEREPSELLAASGGVIDLITVK